MSPGRQIALAALDILPFEPLGDQLRVLCAAAEFAAAGGDREVFVLNGYAGTGKTSLVGALIGALDRLRRRIVVLAPTGRAAKVASSLSRHAASTIHRRIYRPNPSDPTGKSWFVARNECKDTLFIVDESSLISDRPEEGSRGLLSILVGYVYSAPGCRLLLVGDEAQLPPVGQTMSTAMSRDRLSSLGLNPVCHTLDVPVRQLAGSGIIHNATLVRQALYSSLPPENLTLHLSGFKDIRSISSSELADTLSDSFAQVGKEETLIITRSNHRANRFNNAVRNMVMFAEEPLERGDRVIVSKNDYYWGRRNKAGNLIANGDTAEVTWVGKTEKAYGRYFTEVELRLSDGAIVNAQIMLRSLVCDGPSIPRIEMERLYNHVLAAYDGELSEKIKGAMEDPFYNALQIKYAYCVTCHKAQGGQWKHVYIDMGGIATDSMGPEFYRWLYTAMTRATERVFIINPTLPCS